MSNERAGSREEEVSTIILSLRSDLDFAGDPRDLCLHNTRALNSAVAVTFCPEEFLTRRRKDAKKTQGLRERCAVFFAPLRLCGRNLFSAHRGSHCADDGVSDSAFE
jgi:hypothetical protein